MPLATTASTASSVVSGRSATRTRVVRAAPATLPMIRSTARRLVSWDSGRMMKSAASGIQNPSSGLVTRNNTVPVRLAAVRRTACQKGADRTWVARRIVAATSRAHAQPVAPAWRVGSA